MSILFLFFVHAVKQIVSGDAENVSQPLKGSAGGVFKLDIAFGHAAYLRLIRFLAKISHISWSVILYHLIKVYSTLKSNKIQVKRKKVHFNRKNVLTKPKNVVRLSSDKTNGGDVIEI